MVFHLRAALAAFANGARFLHWRTLATLRVPLVWILHVGYAWLVLGLAAAAGAWIDLWPKAVALHALGAGAVATMILAVMSRATLGHTGRKLEAAPLTAAAWKTKPSWGIVAGNDRIINPDLERWYYARAKSRTTEIKGASHSVYVSHAKEVAAVITEAARTLGKATSTAAR